LRKYYYKRLALSFKMKIFRYEIYIYIAIGLNNFDLFFVKTIYIKLVKKSIENKHFKFNKTRNINYRKFEMYIYFV